MIFITSTLDPKMAYFDQDIYFILFYYSQYNKFQGNNCHNDYTFYFVN